GACAFEDDRALLFGQAQQSFGELFECPRSMHYAKTTRRRTNVRTVSTIEPRSAARNPWTRNPGVNSDASFNNSALITSENSPSVRKISGNPKKRKIGPKKKFTTAITAAATIAAPKSRTWMPGMMRATSHNATALNNQFTIRCSTRDNDKPWQRCMLGLPASYTPHGNRPSIRQSFPRTGFWTT